MHPLARTRSLPATDEDLMALAEPGHGVPSQDPDPAAQIPIGKDLAAKEGRTVYIGAGVMAGTAVGVVIGFAAVGPAGVIPAGMVGALAGALGARAFGAARVHSA